jgi:hypothetical protein
LLRGLFGRRRRSRRRLFFVFLFFSLLLLLLLLLDDRDLKGLSLSFTSAATLAVETALPVPPV